MYRTAAILVLALGLTACDAVNTMKDGFKHVRAIESDLATSTGVRPKVAFNWSNGRLTQVSVVYPKLNETKPLHELAETVRASVTREFKQTPENIVLAFSL